MADGGLVAVACGLEKPGNVGAILRSADAAGVSAVIVADGGTDLFNPNCIRASLGTVFTQQVAAATSEQTRRWLAERGYTILAARLDGGEAYDKVDYRGNVALVLGSEAAGLSGVWTAPDVARSEAADARPCRQFERIGSRRGAVLRGAAADGDRRTPETGRAERVTAASGRRPAC